MGAEHREHLPSEINLFLRSCRYCFIFALLGRACPVSFSFRSRLLSQTRFLHFLQQNLCTTFFGVNSVPHSGHRIQWKGRYKLYIIIVYSHPCVFLHFIPNGELRQTPKSHPRVRSPRQANVIFGYVASLRRGADKDKGR